jgi:hypothetical protein
MAHQLTKEVRECADLCSACVEICTESVAHCLALGEKHAEPAHIGLLLDCADVCRANANLLLRGSVLHKAACAFTADVSKHCEESCERLQDDEMMRRCADACRACYESCRRMSGQRAGQSERPQPPV